MINCATDHFTSWIGKEWLQNLKCTKMTNACAKCNCETNVVHCCVSRHSRSSISRRGSGIIESQLFINPSIFPSYSLFMIEIVMMFDVHYSFSETVEFFIPIVRTLNVPYSFSMLSRYSLLRFHPPSILISTWLEGFFCRCSEPPPSVNWFPANNCI